MMPRVSVIIPVYDDEERLTKCLSALAEQVHPAAEIICVDDGSPHSINAPSIDGVRLLRVEHGGSYAARNAGVAAASGDVLAFTDADTVPHPDWLQRGVARLAEDPTSLVAGHVDVTTRASPSGAELVDLFTAFPQEHYAHELNFGVTANLLVSRDTWNHVGPFDGTLRSGGDLEWGRRAGRKGHRAVYAPEIVVAHPARQTLSELWRKHERVRSGLAALERRGFESMSVSAWRYLRPRPRHWWQVRKHPAISGNLILWLRYILASKVSDLQKLAAALRYRQVVVLGRIRFGARARRRDARE